MSKAYIQNKKGLYLHQTPIAHEIFWLSASSATGFSLREALRLRRKWGGTVVSEVFDDDPTGQLGGKEQVSGDPQDHANGGIQIPEKASGNREAIRGIDWKRDVSGSSAILREIEASRREGYY